MAARKILIIEDDVDIRESVQDILELNGFSVLTAAAGEAGLALARRYLPDIIICDVMLPGMDGYGILQALRHEPKTALIPVILLTAKVERADLRRGMELGADDYVTKPFEPQELLKAIKIRIQKHAMVAEHVVTQVQKAEAQLKYFRYYDSVTRLPNFAFLKRYFQRCQHQVHGAENTYSLLLLVVEYAETGQGVSDDDRYNLLMQDIAAELGPFCNAQGQFSSVVAYLGSGQFVLCPRNPLSLIEIQTIAGKITERFHGQFRDHNGQTVTTARLGITQYSLSNFNLEAAINQARMAANQVLFENAVRYSIYQPDVERDILETISFQTRIKQALEQEEFEIHYQPQIDLLTGRLIGAEALIRWRTQSGEMISPAKFIPIAESSGMIIPLGSWIIQRVCHQISGWSRQGLHLPKIAINLSAKQLLSENFCHQMTQNVVQSGLDPSNFVLELTESLLAKDIAVMAEKINLLKQNGFKISIDDFGTGYSSLSYLSSFSFDILKIDQSFVRNIHLEPKNMAIVNSLVSLARGLNLGVIAEGVETLEELSSLRQQKCDAIQGYLISPAVPPHQFPQFLTFGKNLLTPFPSSAPAKTEAE